MMNMSVCIDINSSKSKVWQAITDIQHCQKMISSILAIEVLEQPNEGIIGLKWQETRKMFGKEATEIMWITDAEENSYYKTRAESHGAVYISQLSLEEQAGVTRLTMSFTAQAQSLFAKIMSNLMGFMIQGSMKKALMQDLTDIKAFVEAK